MRNGILIPDLRLVYWFIPKCACTSIKAAVGAHLGMAVPKRISLIHLMPFEIIEGTQAGYYDSWTHFTVVRHPLRRLLSLYNNTIFRDVKAVAADAGTEPIFGRHQHLFTTGMGLPEFLEAIVKVLGSGDPVNAHFKPICQQLPPIDMLVFKTEEMPKFAAWASEVGIKTPIPHLNKTNNGNWSRMLPAKVLAAVEDAYREDFERFDYEKLAPKWAGSV